jgi:hypothetical protein
MKNQEPFSGHIQCRIRSRPQSPAMSPRQGGCSSLAQLSPLQLWAQCQGG